MSSRRNLPKGNATKPEILLGKRKAEGTLERTQHILFGGIRHLLSGRRYKTVWVLLVTWDYHGYSETDPTRLLEFDEALRRFQEELAGEDYNYITELVVLPSGKPGMPKDVPNVCLPVKKQEPEGDPGEESSSAALKRARAEKKRVDAELDRLTKLDIDAKAAKSGKAPQPDPKVNRDAIATAKLTEAWTAMTKEHDGPDSLGIIIYRGHGDMPIGSDGQPTPDHLMASGKMPDPGATPYGAEEMATTHTTVTFASTLVTPSGALQSQILFIVDSCYPYAAVVGNRFSLLVACAAREKAKSRDTGLTPVLTRLFRDAAASKRYWSLPTLHSALLNELRINNLANWPICNSGYRLDENGNITELDRCVMFLPMPADGDADAAFEAEADERSIYEKNVDYTHKRSKMKSATVRLSFTVKDITDEQLKIFERILRCIPTCSGLAIECEIGVGAVTSIMHGASVFIDIMVDVALWHGITGNNHIMLTGGPFPSLDWNRRAPLPDLFASTISTPSRLSRIDTRIGISTRRGLQQL